MALLPAPVSADVDPARTLAIRTGAVVASDPALRPAARWWRRVTEEAFGVDLVPAGPWFAEQPGPSPQGHDAGMGPASSASQRPQVRFALAGGLPDGGYDLTVDDDGVHVTAADLAGAHAAAQTLRQLAGPTAYRRAPSLRPPGRPAAPTAPNDPNDPAEPASVVVLPHAHVVDHPRFAWRGVLLDVARHFLPKADVLRFIDLAAMHKLNVVQLHLTDDQGWRIEVPRYPRLTEVGSWRAQSTVGTWRTGTPDGRPHGGFYTGDDLREMVAYARERGVTLVPEVDVPGHVEAAIAAYPWLGTAKTPHEVRTTWGVSTQVLDPSPAAVAFFADVLEVVMSIFDSPWIALGGDEVPTTAWRADPAIVARAASLGLADVAQLHGWFLAQLCEHVSAAGRRPVVWDEAFGSAGGPGHPALPRDAIVTAWRGWAVGAAASRAGHDVVMAPEQVTYLDHRADDGPDEPIPVGFVRRTADVYAFDPWPPGLGTVAARDRPDDGRRPGDSCQPGDLGPSADPDRPEPPGRPSRGPVRQVTDATSPTPPGRLLGVQAQLWSEHLDSARRVDYAAFPRLAAFAEVAWSPATDRSVGSAASAAFLTRLERDHLPRLDAYGVEYRPGAGPHPWQTRPGVAGHSRDLDAELAAGGLAGVGGWVEGRQGAEPDTAEFGSLDERE